jgi:hypothetical protein
VILIKDIIFVFAVAVAGLFVLGHVRHQFTAFAIVFTKLQVTSITRGFGFYGEEKVRKALLLERNRHEAHVFG